MKNLLTFLLFVPMLFCAQKGVELQFQEGKLYEYKFSGQFPFESLQDVSGKRVEVTGKVLLKVDEVLEGGGAQIMATLSDFKVDTETELGNQLVNLVLDSMMVGGEALWTLSPTGELLEFSSDSFFFADYANQVLALGLFSPILRGAISEGISSMKHAEDDHQFSIQYAAKHIENDGAIVSFQIDSSKFFEGTSSQVSARLCANFNLKDGWAKETFYDIYCKGAEGSEEIGHYTLSLERCN